VANTIVIDHLRSLASRTVDYLRHDAPPSVRSAIGYGGVSAAKTLWRARAYGRSVDIMTAVHSANLGVGIDGAVGELLRKRRQKSPGVLREVYDAYIQSFGRDGELPSALQVPERMLGSRAIVLASPESGQKGVLLLGYSYSFPLFARLFDLASIASRYHIVLEPSWCGLCTKDVLCYTDLGFPVFVECWEPKDLAFLSSSEMNIVPIPVADNWWVDHRVIRPIAAPGKDLDIVMIAAWARFKRHREFFRIVKSLRTRGRALKIALVGYKVDLSKQDILEMAAAEGIVDQLEIHEDLSPEDVVRTLSRAKVHVLWSRNEGANRAHVEALFADVPVILRRGFNFGHQYAHINELTGAYADATSFERVFDEILSSRPRMAPRRWVMEHMTAQHATAILSRAISEFQSQQGESWSYDLAVKTVMVGSQHYWDPGDAARFASDYEYLHSRVQPCA
jgi:glycosyltransferase involved in cell wall biosynthesis